MDLLTRRQTEPPTSAHPPPSLCKNVAVRAQNIDLRRRHPLIPIRVDADSPDASKIVHYQWYTRPRESRRQRGLVLSSLSSPPHAVKPTSAMCAESHSATLQEPPSTCCCLPPGSVHCVPPGGHRLVRPPFRRTDIGAGASVAGDPGGSPHVDCGPGRLGQDLGRFSGGDRFAPLSAITDTGPLRHPVSSFRLVPEPPAATTT
jgi:hypothetical protein